MKRRKRNTTVTETPLKSRRALPPDPQGCNADRARCAESVLKEYQRQTGCHSQIALSALLADLMHWCDRSGQVFEFELLRANGYYEDATTEFRSEMYGEEY